jgi:hypothetical protein
MPLSGSGTMTPATPGTSTPGVACLEYLTIADLRAEFGDALAADSDAALQKRLDALTSHLETILGQTFGRGLIAQSTATENVEVAADNLVIGGHTFSFASYPTLDELIYAVNTAGHAFRLTRLPQVRSDTPSTLLSLHGAQSCGPTYDKRVVLCLDALYCKLTGKCSSHAFLPLNLAGVVTVTENALALTILDYWAVPGDSWLIRKACGCLSACSCGARGAWASSYPGNLTVSFVPEVWGQVPPVVADQVLEAYRARYDLGALASESFGEYKYTRKLPESQSWQNLLGGNGVRQYGVKFQP